MGSFRQVDFFVCGFTFSLFFSKSISCWVMFVDGPGVLVNGYVLEV